MKQIYSAILLLFLCSTITFAQTPAKDKISIFGGYEHFPELRKRNGYNIGIEYRHYLRKRIYTVINAHAGVNDGVRNEKYEREGIQYNFDLSNSVRDYMIGLGVGFEVLQKNKHIIYLQGTFGLGTTDIEQDYITLSPGGAYDIVKTNYEEHTRFAISATAGYDYQINNLLAIGVNYTCWQIGYESKNAANVRISFCF